MRDTVVDTFGEEMRHQQLLTSVTSPGLCDEHGAPVILPGAHVSNNPAYEELLFKEEVLWLPANPAYEECALDSKVSRDQS